MRRNVLAFAAALLLLASCGSDRQLKVLVIDQNGAPIPNAHLEIRRFTIIPLLQTRIGAVVTDPSGQAAFLFSASSDYSIFLTGKACGWRSGNHVFHDSAIIAGGPLIVRTRSVTCNQGKL